MKGPSTYCGYYCTAEKEYLKVYVACCYYLNYVKFRSAAGLRGAAYLLVMLFHFVYFSKFQMDFSGWQFVFDAFVLFALRILLDDSLQYI